MAIPGRDTACTQEIIDLVCKNIIDGLPNQYAAELGGICAKSFYNWVNRGEHDAELCIDSIYVTFAQSVKKARAERVARKIANIARCAQDRVAEDGRVIKGDWQADAWFLERSDPEHFGKNTCKINLEFPTEGIHTIEALDKFSAEVTNKFCTNQITAEQAFAAAKIIEERRKIIETCNLATRVDSIEDKMKGTVIPSL